MIDKEEEEEEKQYYNIYIENIAELKEHGNLKDAVNFDINTSTIRRK